MAPKTIDPLDERGWFSLRPTSDLHDRYGFEIVAKVGRMVHTFSRDDAGPFVALMSLRQARDFEKRGWLVEHAEDPSQVQAADSAEKE